MTHYDIHNDEQDKVFCASLKLRNSIMDTSLATYPLSALPLLLKLMEHPSQLYRSDIKELCCILHRNPDDLYEE